MIIVKQYNRKRFLMKTDVRVDHAIFHILELRVIPVRISGLNARPVLKVLTDRQRLKKLLIIIDIPGQIQSGLLQYLIAEALRVRFYRSCTFVITESADRNHDQDDNAGDHQNELPLQGTFDSTEQQDSFFQ